MTIARLFLKRQMPPPAVDEVRLLHEVALAYPELDLAHLSTERLGTLARERGVDFATALFYDRVRRSPQHGPFIAAVEGIEPDLAALPRLGGKLLVSPALFYREFPEYGGDGELIRRIAAQFGIASALFPVPSGGSVREWVPILQETLAKEEDGSVFLVSFSQGGAASRLALAGEPALARKVRAWIQLCGLVRGFPVFNLFLMESRLRAWWRVVVRLYFATMQANPALASDLLRGPGTLLDGVPTAPPPLLVLNILGFPLQGHLSGFLRARHRQLAPLGPNDGFTLLRDAIVEPGPLYPVWAANHYFRFPGRSRLLYQLFLYLARVESGRG